MDDMFASEKAEISRLFSEELELSLWNLSSYAEYRVTSVDGVPAQHRIIVSCYNDEVYRSFRDRSGTDCLTVSDLDFKVRYGQVGNHANIVMRVLHPGMDAEGRDPDMFLAPDAMTSLRDLLIRAYQLGGYGAYHDRLNSNEITEEQARSVAVEAIGTEQAAIQDSQGSALVRLRCEAAAGCDLEAEAHDARGASGSMDAQQPPSERSNPSR